MYRNYTAIQRPPITTMRTGYNYKEDQRRYQDSFFSFGGPGMGLHSKQDPFSMLGGGDPATDAGTVDPSLLDPATDTIPIYQQNVGNDPNNEYADFDIYGNPIETDADGYITKTTLPDGKVISGSVTGTVDDNGALKFTADDNGPGKSSGTGSKIGDIVGSIFGLNKKPTPPPPAPKQTSNQSMLVIVAVVVLVVFVIIAALAGKKGMKK
jgi:hypothetical protein